jgi:ubiquinone/menaquinone biosynthesis C-methylase UbiE
MRARHRFRGKSGQPFASLEWLALHHAAKADHRRRAVAELDLAPRSRVLDVACGPGFWANLFREAVGPDGKVVGVDVNSDLLEYACILRSENGYARETLSFSQTDFHALPFPDETFDVVILLNSLSYTERPIAMLEEQLRVLKRGGRLIAQNYDNTTCLAHPISEELLNKVMYSKAKHLNIEKEKEFFDWCAGKKLPGYFRNLGLNDIRISSILSTHAGRLSQQERQYLAHEFWTYGDAAAEYLSSEELSRWRQAFDPIDPNSILASDDAFVAQVEIRAQGRKP